MRFGPGKHDFHEVPKKMGKGTHIIPPTYQSMVNAIAALRSPDFPAKKVAEFGAPFSCWGAREIKDYDEKHPGLLPLGRFKEVLSVWFEGSGTWPIVHKKGAVPQLCYEWQHNCRRWVKRFDPINKIKDPLKKADALEALMHAMIKAKVKIILRPTLERPTTKGKPRKPSTEPRHRVSFMAGQKIPRGAKKRFEDAGLLMPGLD